MSARSRRLLCVKLLHTFAWAILASCVVAIPWAAWTARFGLALILIGIISVESLVLLANGWRCPLTGVAARYTDDRRSNFDIYLPEALARCNKEIFGTLFVGGVLITLYRWFSRAS